MYRKAFLQLIILLFVILTVSCVTNTGTFLLNSEPEHNLEIVVNGETVKTPYVLDVKKGEEIKVSASTETVLDIENWFPGEDTKFEFEGWTGFASTTSNDVVLEPEFGEKLVANYEAVEFKVIYVEKFVENSGIDVTKDSSWYSCGEIIKFEPGDYQGFEFVCWRIQDSSELVENFSSQRKNNSVFLSVKTPIIVEAIYEAEDFESYKKVNK